MPWPSLPRLLLPQTIYHNPKDTHVAICTVGGICPGLNDVVRGLVHKVGWLPHLQRRAGCGLGRF